MSTEESRLRENRRKNFSYIFDNGSTSPQYLAKRLVVDTSYVSQLKNGFRPITFDVARQIEEALGMLRLSLDNPPGGDGRDVSALTDKELSTRVSSVLREVCREHNKQARGDFYDAMLRLCTLDAQLRGYSEARIRFIAKEFMS